MSDIEKNKEIVFTWLTTFGESPDKAAEFITDDFVWYMPQSVSSIFPHIKNREARGVEGLKLLLNLDKEVYAEGHHGENTVHFVAAEGDWVVIQQEFATKTIHGVPYRNTYCFNFRLRDGKIAEAWEHSDTLYAKETFNKKR